MLVANMLTFERLVDGGQLGVFFWGTDSEKDKSVPEAE